MYFDVLYKNCLCNLDNMTRYILNKLSLSLLTSVFPLYIIYYIQQRLFARKQIKDTLNTFPFQRRFLGQIQHKEKNNET